MQRPASPGQRLFSWGPQPSSSGFCSQPGLGEGMPHPHPGARGVGAGMLLRAHGGRKQWFPSQRLLAVCLPDLSSNPAHRLAGRVTLGRALNRWMGSFLVCTAGELAQGVSLCGLDDTPVRSSHREPGTSGHSTLFFLPSALLWKCPPPGDTVDMQRNTEAGRARCRGN